MKRKKDRGGSAGCTEAGVSVPDGIYANAMTDFMFKRIFGNERIMLPFLNGILPDAGIVGFEYISPENFGDDRDDRKAVFDLACRTLAGEEVIVEMQMAEQKHFRKRAVAYSAYPVVKQARRMREEHLASGGDFTWNYDLKPVYFVGMLNFSLGHAPDWPEDRYISTYELRESETGELLSDTLHYVFVELGRFLKSEDECTSFMDMLLYSIKTMHLFGKMPASFTDDVIGYLYKLSEMLNFTADELESYKKSLNMNWDIKNIEDFAREKGYNAGHAEGKAEGVAEGREEAFFETGRRLKSLGASLGMIIEATGLSRETVEAL